MKYYSINDKNNLVDFKTAVINGIASDKSLYFPSKIPVLNTSFFNSIEKLNNNDIAFEIIKPFINNYIPDDKLYEIIKKTINFEFPVKKINDSIFVIELYHGPTLAFKDVGACFMAQTINYLNISDNKSTVLVATSGDTGAAVANAFLDIQGVDVIILYPDKKISNFQEQQLTTFGNNIHALSVNGVFDDCQNMVKKAFLDVDLKFSNLTSANSINIARWLPQMFYYFFLYKKLKYKNKNLIVSVPSGNFGNICAGMLARKMGLPIKTFIASTNINDIIPKYLKNGFYETKKSKETISNAMDVGNPSNFIRIQELYNKNYKLLKNNLLSYSYSDIETKIAIKELFNNFKYISEPHGAIGYLGLKEFIKKNNNFQDVGVFLETAHPIKFLDIIKKIINVNVEVPVSTLSILNKKKISIKINDYEELKSYIKKIK